MSNTPENRQNRGLGTVMSRRNVLRLGADFLAGGTLAAVGLSLNSNAEAQGVTGGQNPEPTGTPGDADNATKVAEVSTPSSDSAGKPDVLSVEGSNVDGFNSAEDAVSAIRSAGLNVTEVTSRSLRIEGYEDTSVVKIEGQSTLYIAKDKNSQKYFVLNGRKQRVDFDTLGVDDTSKGSEKPTSQEQAFKLEGDGYVATIPAITSKNIENIPTNLGYNIRMYGSVVWQGQDTYFTLIVTTPDRVGDGMVWRSGKDTWLIKNVSKSSEHGADIEAYLNEENVEGKWAKLNGGEYVFFMEDLQTLASDAGVPPQDYLLDPAKYWPKKNGRPFYMGRVRLSDAEQSRLTHPGY